MANPSRLDLPIALRRTPRRCVSAAAAPPTHLRVVSAPVPAILKTPSKSRPKKRVRFSDPGISLAHHEETNTLFSTGLTPMIKRSSLSGLAAKRRRGPAAQGPASAGDLQNEESTDEIDVLSLPQTLGDRAQRRIGETSTTPKRKAKTSTRKANAATAKIEAEAQRLRAELASRDAEIERLHSETLVHDTERIVELEQQLETLRAELAQQQQLPAAKVGDEDENADVSDGDSENELPQSFYDWTLAAQDPFSDGYLDGDDGLQDIVMPDVVCSTPSRRQKSAGAAAPRSVSASFPTPPCTSPTIPATPCSFRRATASATPAPAAPHSHTGIQASLPDPDKQALEAELVSLRLELTKMTVTLDAHAALQARLSEKLSGAAMPSSSTADGENSSSELEENVNSVIQQLSERTTALVEVNSSLSTLGFTGTDAGEIISSITSAFRSARLELEYLHPGEVTLPLSSHGAEVLDLVLTRLRDLARKVHADEETIDEYHALEFSLRQQLTARVEAMDSLEARHNECGRKLFERDSHIADLEVGLDRLKRATATYQRDISELEALVERLEDSGQATEAKLQAVLDSSQERVCERVAATAELEAKLAASRKQAEELETQLKDVQRRKEAEAKVRNKSGAAALALRDARVAELRREIYGINESLRSAHDTVMKLRLENAELERRAEKAEEAEKRAREAIDTMKAELEKVTAAAAAVPALAAAPRRVTRSRSRESMGLATPEPQVGSFLSGGLARSGAGKGKKRRRYDSGLGLLDEDEVDL